MNKFDLKAIHLWKTLSVVLIFLQGASITLYFILSQLSSISSNTMYQKPGLHVAIIGPTTVDLVEIHNTNTEMFSRASMMYAVGSLAGALLGSTVFDKFKFWSDLYISLGSLLLGACSVAIPWCPGLVSMGLLWGIQGLVYVSCEVICQAAVLAIWGAKASVPIASVFSGYTIGTVLAPLMVTPFLSQNPVTAIAYMTTPETLGNHSTDSSASVGNHSEGVTQRVYMLFESTSPAFSSNSTKTGYQDMLVSRIYIPYLIVGLIGVLGSIIFGMFFWMGHTYDTIQKDVDKAKTKHPRQLQVDPGNTKFHMIFLTFLSIVYLFTQWRNYCFTMYIFSIAVESQLKMRKQEAGLINTSYNTAFCIGRIIYAFLVAFLPIQLLMHSHAMLSVITSILIYLFGLDGKTQFWTLTSLHGLFVGPSFPAILAWANCYIECNGFVCGVMWIGSATGGIIGMWLNGWVFENYGTWRVLVFNLGLTVIVAVTLVSMQVCAHLQGERHMGKTSLITEVEPSTEEETSPLITESV